MNEKQFPQGIRVYAPHEKAPDFIIADIVVKKNDFINYLKSFSCEDIPLQIKKSKNNGNLYVDLNTYRLDYVRNQQGQQEIKQPEFDDNDVPF